MLNPYLLTYNKKTRKIRPKTMKAVQMVQIPSYGVNRDTGVNRDKNPESFCNAIIYIFLQLICLVLITVSSIDIEVPSHARED